METFAARLASFDTVLSIGRSRSSSSKSNRIISWPHSKPSPAELAHAGFYYKPYETNPDNTICFLCGRGLDGWEEEDNPIAEHLKHSPDCGWAIMMDIQQRSSNPAEIQDPTSDRIAEARRATFMAGWPHEGKKGWICQSDKMVAAGWYFCPHEDSPDLAACAYCKLSLDGWEPTDDPFEEHYRRSADCSFFVFALSSRKSSKSSRSKKSRSSKSSRLSTQSTASVDSEASSITEDTLDTSISSQSTGKSSKGSKRAATSKRKKTKKDDSSEASIQMEPETLEESKSAETVKATRATRGKKRASEDVVEYVPAQTIQEPSPVPEGPPRKRRATRSQSSAVKEMERDNAKQGTPDDTSLDEDVPPAKQAKGRRGSKRSSIATTNRTTVISTATKASLRNRIPDDSELEEALEADLERDMSDDEPFEFQYKDSNAEKARKESVSASVALTRASRPAEKEVQKTYDARENGFASEEDPDVVKSTKMKARKQTSRKAATKKSKKDITPEPELGSRPEPEPAEEPEFVDDHQVDDYQVDETPSESRAAAIETEDEFDDNSNEVAVASPPKEEPVKKRAPSKAKKPAKAPVEEDVAASTSRGHTPIESKPRLTKKTSKLGDDYEQNIEQTPSDNSKRSSGRVSNVPPKTVQRYSDIPREQQHTQTLLESMAQNRSPQYRAGTARVQTQPVTIQETTPSPSPQSSDAENQPPSSRPSATRPPLMSPSRSQTARVPLAASTPAQSPSKRRPDAGQLTTTFPWTPVDVDELLFGDSGDKENNDLNIFFDGGKDALSTPEKKMTVEEWIRFNAERAAEQLRRECERVVGLFEREGGRAMKALEGIECID